MLLFPLTISRAELLPPGRPPSLPFYDWDAHPGEHCGYRKWTARRPAIVYDTGKLDHEAISQIAKGDSVLGVKGVIITFQPGIIRMERDLPQHNLKRGDRILTYAHRGEGFSAVWFAGAYHSSYDISFAKWPNGGGCGGNRCAATYLTSSRTEWWAQVQLKSGLTGWVKADSAAFQGACGE